MIYSIIVTEQAKNDIEQAAEWYEQQQKGLSKKFMTSVKNSMKIQLTLEQNKEK